MAKAVRGRTRKAAKRKSSAPAKRQQPKRGLAPDKFRALVYNLSLSELNELLKVATERKNEEIANARASFLDELKARAASLGMSLADLVGLGAGKASGKSVKRAPSNAKYRNPTTGETWSGRDRPAKWLTELEAKGHKREEFAV